MLIWLSFLWDARAEPVCAKRAATLRKGAGETFAVSWKVPRFMPFVRVDRKGTWVKLQDLEGEAHWAHAADVTNTLRCVVVKANSATLRKEPSAASPTPDLKSVDRYTPFQRVSDQGEWVQVKDEVGHVAWIQAAQIWKPVTVNAISF